MAETEIKKINGRTVCDQTARDSIPKSASDIGADPAGTGASKVNAHNTSLIAHNDIRVKLQSLLDQVNSFFNVDDETRNELSEVLDLIDANKDLIEEITTKKVNVTDIINNLTTNISNQPLSAAQGVALKELIDTLQTAIDNISVPTKLSDLAEDSTHRTVTDEEKDSWNLKVSGAYDSSTKTLKLFGGGYELILDCPSEETAENILFNLARKEEVEQLSKEIVGQQETINNLVIGKVDVAIPTKNKKMIVFGDSITKTATMNDDGSNYVEDTRTNWLTYAKEILKITSFKNYAEDGATYKDSSSATLHRQWVSRQIALAMNDTGNDDADIIVLSLGTNDLQANDDYASAMAVATVGALDRTKLHQAIRYAMWTLKTKYPNAKCFCTTPIQRAAHEQDESLRNAIISMANRYNFKVIDAEYESGICRDNEVLSGEGVDLADGLHPNTNGKIKLARFYSSAILGEFLYDAYNYSIDADDGIKLPDEYQQVEYIESSGTQYIDTGVLASDYSGGIGYVFNGVVYSTNTGDEWLWGALNSSKRSGNMCASNSYSKFALYAGGANEVARSVPITYDEDVTITAFSSSLTPTEATLSVNGVTDTDTDGAVTSSDMPTINVFLFKCNGSSRTPSKAKVYSFKMTDVNGVELRNFIPCYRKADNVIGLYDVVSGAFYTNAGTGAFTKGSNVN